ncbi:LysR family transcriptional regulator [Bacteriovorax sp. DB6_IX]|uniref:LysR family transcriptional regulator n=1 Tax=Bacteriovorax sp. DB6_IX TaxID=1353530 RepID=UPI0009DC0164|nr:LysR family transcriptional regulator [Bacteriovorax sp. DB6_IX]
MIIDQLSLTGLRVFITVYRVKSMSLAAKELFMTQPGVSQHIKNIEETLQVKLFDRLNRKLVPTSEAVHIFEEVTPILHQLERSLSTINQSEQSLTGTINFGMPIEFGNNVILPHLSTWAKSNTDVKFHINYDHAARQINQLLDGSLDFAITDSFTFPTQVEVENLAREEWILCASKEYAKDNRLNEVSTFKQMKELHYISYLENSPVIHQWFKHHKNKTFDLKSRARLMDVQGVARLILEGVGLGILSRHMVRENNLEDKIVIFEGSGVPLYNEINLVKLKGKTMSLTCQSFVEYLVQKLKK